MDLLATLLNLGLVAILCVNLAAVSRLRHTLNSIETRISNRAPRHAPARLQDRRGQQEALQTPLQAHEAPVSAEEEELECLITAAVAATLKHERFRVLQITPVMHS